MPRVGAGGEGAEPRIGRGHAEGRQARAGDCSREGGREPDVQDGRAPSRAGDAAGGQAGQQADDPGRARPSASCGSTRGAIDDSDEGEPRNAAPKTIVLGDLPPGVQPINAVDMTARRHACRRRAGQCRAGLRRRFRARDRVAGRPQGPDPIPAVQPRRSNIWPREATRSSRSGLPRRGL